MKVLDPGHDYELDVLDGDFKIQLTFVKRVGEMYPGNTIDYPGTNMQEVIRALIDRCKYVNEQIQDFHTERTLTLLRGALYNLEARAAKRHGRDDKWFMGIGDLETYSTCPKCGHIGCTGECHE